MEIKTVKKAMNEYKSQQISKYEQNLESFKNDLQAAIKIIAESHEIPECPICLEHIIKSERITKCGHIFHRACIKNIDKCPICRTDIGVKKQKHKQLLVNQVGIMFIHF